MTATIFGITKSVNRSNGNPAFFRNFPIGSTRLDSHFLGFIVGFIRIFRSYAVFSKFSIPVMGFAASISLSINCVLYILFLSANIQMFWIYAARIITFMKHPKIIWNFSSANNPRNPVRSGNFSVKRNLSIARSVLETRPIPTGLRFINPFPEPLLKRCVAVLAVNFSHLLVMLRAPSFAVSNSRASCYFTSLLLCHNHSCDTSIATKIFKGFLC